MKDIAQRFLTRFVLLAMTAALTACGGGSDSGVGSASMKSSPRATSKAASTTNDYLFPLQQIYVGYFGRPADPGGLAYFATQYQAAGAPTNIVDISKAYSTNPTLKALIDSFGTSAESQALYPGNNDTFINAIYLNLFNRNADTAGQQYWVNLINTGVMTRANAALSIIAGAQSTDAVVINKKADVASRFTSSLTTPALTAAYSGLDANVVVRQMLAGVALTTDTTAFQGNFAAVLATLQANQPSPIASLASCPTSSIVTLPNINACLNFTLTGTSPYTGSACSLTVNAGGITLSSAGIVSNIPVGGTQFPAQFFYAKELSPFNPNPAAFHIEFGGTTSRGENVMLSIFSREYVNTASKNAGFDVSDILFPGIKTSGGSLACLFSA